MKMKNSHRSVPVPSVPVFDAPHVNHAATQLETELSQPMFSTPRANQDASESNDLPKQIDTLRRNRLMSLYEKRQKKAELVQSDSQRVKQHAIGIFRRAKFSFSMSLQKCRESMNGFLYSFELWYSDIKLLEGHVGSGLVSYFRFLRWLFLLNSVMLMISFSFLSLPQILSQYYENVDGPTALTLAVGDRGNEYSFSDTVGFNETRSSLLTGARLVLRDALFSVNQSFSLDDLFTGEGFLSQTPLYYGSYTNETIELIEGYTYNIPNAYFLSIFICYFLFLITVSISMARSYRTTFIETKGGQKNVHALKVFCGWDFSIATHEAAALNHKHVYLEIKEVLNEIVDQRDDHILFSLFSIVLIHFSINIMFVILLGGIGFLMWNLLGRNSLRESGNEFNDVTTYTMMMSIFISVIMNILPKGFSWIVRYEGYHNPRTAFYVTLLRTFLLNVLVVVVLLAYWVNLSGQCWQTSLGQEIYRLMITDFIISILFMEALQILWSWISKKYRNKSDQPEFDIAWNSLNLIYNQTLFLVGMYFSPLLSVVIVLKLFITFYIKKAGILVNTQTLPKSWRASQTQTVFFILTFVTIFGVCLLIGYILVETPPSNCGPFRGQESTYKVIFDGVLTLENDHYFWKVVMFLVKPGVIAAVLVAMSAATYILSARAEAHSILADILRNMIVVEAKDKAFLFKHIKSIEQTGYTRSSPISSPSSFYHTPLSEKKYMSRRVSGDNVQRTQFGQIDFPESSKDGLHRYDFRLEDNVDEKYFPQPISPGTSRITSETEFSDLD